MASDDRGAPRQAPSGSHHQGALTGFPEAAVKLFFSCDKCSPRETNAFAVGSLLCPVRSLPTNHQRVCLIYRFQIQPEANSHLQACEEQQRTSEPHAGH